jgi:hypothetical protein
LKSNDIRNISHATKILDIQLSIYYIKIDNYLHSLHCSIHDQCRSDSVIKEGIMKMFRFLFILLSATMAIAQPNPDTLWTRTYGGSNDDWAYSVQQTADGGYILAGATESSGAGGRDFYLVKTNSSGNTTWSRTYGGSNHEVAWCVQQTSDGGYILAGYTESFGAGQSDFYVVKTNSIGDTSWTRTFGGSSWDGAHEVKQTADGGYIIAGHTWSFGPSADAYLVKTDNMGISQWARTYGSMGWDEANSVQQTTDGGYIFAGFATPMGLADCYLVKTNNIGDTLWTRIYGGSAHDQANSVQQTSDGGYIMAGYTGSFTPGIWNVYLIKTNSNGDSSWTNIYGMPNSAMGVSVLQTVDGAYVLCGVVYLGAGNDDFYLLKTSSLGNVLWSRTYGGSSSEQAHWVQQTTDGGYVVAGITDSYGAGLLDGYLVKTGPEPSSGYLSLVSSGPPNWGYRLHQTNGCIWRLMFTNFCPNTTGSLSGNASSSWSMLPNGDGNDGDSIIFVASTPLCTGSIDTFWLSHPTCSGNITWQGGDSSGTIAGPLPVELTTFEAIAGDGFVKLHWRTESETNNHHFVLYKRVSGSGGFNTLGVVPGQGTTTSPHEYKFIDHWVVNGVTYEYLLADVDINGVETVHDIMVSATPHAGATIPMEYALHQNFPNPFNAVTSIRFDVKETGQVILKVFNLMGRDVATLVDGDISAGAHTISWDAGDLPSGVYLYRMEASDFRQIRKLVLLK